mgnify:CR=1 FL=1
MPAVSQFFPLYFLLIDKIGNWWISMWNILSAILTILSICTKIVSSIQYLLLNVHSRLKIVDSSLTSQWNFTEFFEASFYSSWRRFQHWLYNIAKVSSSNLASKNFLHFLEAWKSKEISFFSFLCFSVFWIRNEGNFASYLRWLRIGNIRK